MNNVSADELRKVSKSLVGHSSLIKLSKYQADSLNNNLVEGQELYNEGDLYNPYMMFCTEDFIHDMKNLEAQIIADKITESYISKYPFGGLK